MTWSGSNVRFHDRIPSSPTTDQASHKGALLDNQNVARLGGEVQRRHVGMVAETDVDVVTFQKTSNDAFDAAVVVAILPTVEERLAGDEQRRLALERSPVDVAIGCKEEQG